MKTIHELPLKAIPEPSDEFELQEVGGGVSKRVSGAMIVNRPQLLPVSLSKRNAGQNYHSGFYHFPTTSVVLTQASASVSHGSANEAAGSRMAIIAGGAGTVDTGTVALVATGNSITEDGVQVIGDTEVLVADITTLSLNEGHQTSKKFTGIMTFALVASGGAAVYSVALNYGHVRFDDAGDTDFILQQINLIGEGSANDPSFNFEVLHHKMTGWTYAAAGFVPGNGVIASIAGDYGADTGIVNGEGFSWARKGLNKLILGTKGEGVIISVTTTVNNSIEFADANLVADPA